MTLNIERANLQLACKVASPPTRQRLPCTTQGPFLATRECNVGAFSFTIK